MEKLRAYLKGTRGALTDLAAALGVHASAISQWRRVPADRLRDVERLTGIPRAELRPDLFGDTDAA